MQRLGWLKSSRFYIVLASAIVAAAYYFWIISTIKITTSQAVKLDLFYALAGVIMLYLFMLVTPLVSLFSDFPLRTQLMEAKKAFGIAALLFALLHGYFAFFQELGGFGGLGFLNDKYIWGISISATALLILCMAIAGTFGWITARIPWPQWSWLKLSLDVVLLLTLVHALILGSDFTSFSNLIPQLFFIGIALLFGLESFRLDQYIEQHFEVPRFGVSFGAVLVLLSAAAIYVYFPTSGSTQSPFNVHAQHIELAKQAQQGQGNLANLPSSVQNLPSLQGDRTKRFTVSFLHPDNVTANTDTKLQFLVNDASSGNPVELYSRVYEKPIHLIVVDSSLQYFSHIHPDQQLGGFTINTQFPHDGQYHLYIDFQPLGAIEQQFAFVINVGNANPATATQPPDTNLTKDFGNYEVTLTKPDPLQASSMSIGGQTMTFTINDAKTKQPITTLKPYLASFGHLVMINEQTYDYLHVHPTNLVAPAPNSNGGPKVEFMPLGLYGPIKPGTYRVFAQFNPDNNLFTADFTVKVE